MTRAEKITRAKALREGGLTYTEIAERLGLNGHSAAWHYVNKARPYARENHMTGRRYGDPLPPVDSSVWDWIPEGPARNVAMVTAMRAAGWLYREISEHTGMPKSTIESYIHDPTGRIARERKARLYTKPCIDCGTPTNSNGLKKRTLRCQACENERVLKMDPVERALARQHMEKVYSDAFIFECLRSAATDGRVTVKDYEGWRAGRKGIPSLPLIASRFGWNTAVRLAGLEPGRTYRTYKRQTCEGCLAAVQRLADELGRVPTYREYESYAHDHAGFPSAVLVRIRCGGKWLNVAKALTEELAVAA